MATPIRVRDEINTLKHDAAKVLQDITKLSSQLRHAGAEQIEEVGTEVSHAMHGQLADMREKLGELNKTMGKYAGKVHTSVKANPYAFICGAIGAGYLLGKFLPPRFQSRD